MLQMSLSDDVFISNADQECVSFLMTLKHRAVTPPSSSRPSRRTPSTSQKDVSAENDIVRDVPTLNTFSTSTSMPLATEEDPMYLSPAQCFIRMYCVEYFVSDGDGNNDYFQGASRPSAVSMLSTSCGSIEGGRGPVSAARVGIRCSFCKHSLPNTRAAQFMSFPSTLSGICGAVGMIQCRHLHQCTMVPTKVKDELHILKQRGSRNGSQNWAGRQQFWVDSAKKLGLFDTEDGIRLMNSQINNDMVFHSPALTSNTRNSLTSIASFQTMTPLANNYDNPRANKNNKNDCNSRIERSPLANISMWGNHQGPLFNNLAISDNILSTSIWNQSETNNVSFDYIDSLDNYHKSRVNANQQEEEAKTKLEDQQDEAKSNIKYKINSITDETLVKLMGDTTLVGMQDKDLIPKHLLLAMAQMQTCRLTEADRVGCYKEREIGFLGMCCKHCGGQPGFGKYFPGTVRSLAQTTTSQTIVKHIAVKCRLCPPEIRLAMASLNDDQGNADRALKDPRSTFESKPRYGSRKIFFQRLWNRLHGSDKHISEPVFKERCALVSPQCKDSNAPKHHGDLTPSITRETVKGRDSVNNENNIAVNHFHGFYQSIPGEKRSRTVSYLQEENVFHPHSKMSRLVSDSDQYV